MKKLIVILMTLSMLLAVTMSCSPTKDWNLVAFNEINKLRQESGIPQLKWDDELYELALVHSQEMADAGEIFHSDTGVERYKDTWYAENVAYSDLAIPQLVVQGWNESALHRINLLSEMMTKGAIAASGTGSIGVYVAFITVR